MKNTWIPGISRKPKGSYFARGFLSPRMTASDCLLVYFFQNNIRQLFNKTPCGRSTGSEATWRVRGSFCTLLIAIWYKEKPIAITPPSHMGEPRINFVAVFYYYFSAIFLEIHACALLRCKNHDHLFALKPGELFNFRCFFKHCAYAL